ncbi:hypothetical protein [Mucilaginibacter sp.]
MNGATYIFWIIFVIPLIAFLIWLVRQDKRTGKIGIAVVIGLVIMVIIYMYVKHMFAPYTPVYD